MKIIGITLLVFFLTSFKLIDPAKDRTSKWAITESSTLIVNGSTNINKFSCTIAKYPSTDTVSVSANKASNLTLTGKIHIEVKYFNCTNSMMTKELRKTLKENEFPFLHISFLSLQEMRGASQKSSTIKGDVAIEIAGKTKHFDITYHLNKSKNTMTLTGNQLINFSDFNLLPPKKLGKLIRVKDELKVALCLKMELI